MDIKAILGEGYTPELEKKINEEVGKNFVPREKYNTANERLQNANDIISARNEQIKELGEVGKGSKKLEDKIRELTESNDKAKLEYENKLKATRERAI